MLNTNKASPAARRLCHYAIVTTWISLNLACPPQHEYSRDFPTNIPVPLGTTSASVDITAQVPEGDWSFYISAEASEIESHEAPLHDDPPVDYNIPTKGRTYYRLRCPEGLCRFQLTARPSVAQGRLQISAGFTMEPLDEPNSGCDKADANNTDDETIARLFKVDYELYDLIPPASSQL